MVAQLARVTLPQADLPVWWKWLLSVDPKQSADFLHDRMLGSMFSNLKLNQAGPAMALGGPVIRFSYLDHYIGSVNWYPALLHRIGHYNSQRLSTFEV